MVELWFGIGVGEWVRDRGRECVEIRVWSAVCGDREGGMDR